MPQATNRVTLSDATDQHVGGRRQRGAPAVEDAHILEQGQSSRDRGRDSLDLQIANSVISLSETRYLRPFSDASSLSSPELS